MPSQNVTGLRKQTPRLADRMRSSSLRWRRRGAVPRLLLAGAAVGLATLGMAGPAAPRAIAAGPPPRGNRTISDDLKAQALAYPTSGTKKSVIVQFRSRASLDNDDAEVISRFTGGELRRKLRVINGAAMRIPYRALLALSALPEVAWISPDRQLGSTWDQDVEAQGADQAWTAVVSPGNVNTNGAGVGVAIIDSGVKPGMADLAGSGSSRLVAFQDFVGTQTTAYDDYGHGTHVAGIIAGNGASSGGLFRGVAPKANIVALKVLDASGTGTSSTVITALNWCVTNKATYNLRVVNLSVGRDPAESATTDPLCAAVRNCVQAGLVVVCSAGNKGKDLVGAVRYGGISSPANEPASIAVGAGNTKGTTVRTDDAISSYSSRGPTALDQFAKPDVAAPGNKIISLRSVGSTLDNENPGNRVSGYNNDYFELSGTSMAAPQVAGIAALMLQANPNLTPGAVKALLMFTAEDMALKDANNVALAPGVAVITQGAGSVNALLATKAASLVNASAATGQSWLSAAIPTTTTIGGAATTRSGVILHGSSKYTGADLMNLRQALYGSSVLWGDSTSWTSNVASASNQVQANQSYWVSLLIWGDSVLWGDTVLWGDSLNHLKGIRSSGD